MSATTGHEVDLMKMYKEEERVAPIEEEIIDEVEYELDELFSKIVSMYEERGLYIDTEDAIQIVKEYTDKELSAHQGGK